MLALPESIVALRELWVRWRVAAPATRSSTKLEIRLRLSIHRG
jgi:hypothetical protein